MSTNIIRLCLTPLLCIAQIRTGRAQPQTDVGLPCIPCEVKGRRGGAAYGRTRLCGASSQAWGNQEKSSCLCPWALGQVFLRTHREKSPTPWSQCSSEVGRLSVSQCPRQPLPHPLASSPQELQ